ncbi:hypothetical protein MMC17_007213 [Xylographa soralifera]|nr:hypothetical protein [Xylographa soralifera]
MADTDPKSPVGHKVAILQKQQDELVQRSSEARKLKWSLRILKQGPWDEVKDPLPLTGAPAIPAPVDLASTESLAPLFSHLAINGREHLNAKEYEQDTSIPTTSEEPYYGTKMQEFANGTVYEDGRLDMCKFPVGPRHIKDLMQSLDHNELVKHFVVGNNLMGRAGANSIAEFVRAHPNRMETWYVAGNCLDAHDLRILASAWMHSPVITNIWLKRNPLGPDALPVLREIITHVKKLRTLDLDQTELGNDAVRQLFAFLADKAAHTDRDGALALQNLYLNATGIGASACAAISHYLSGPHCTLESLYMSNNPLGTSGLLALCNGLTPTGPSLVQNRSLVRLSLTSCGLSARSVAPLLRALTAHPTLAYLDLGQSYATDDLNARYNYLSSSSAAPNTDADTDSADLIPALTAFITHTPHLRFLALGTTALPHPALDALAPAVLASPSLLAYTARSALPSFKSDTLRRRIRDAAVNKHLWQNVQAAYPGRFESYGEFEAGELRWVRSPRDVRLIDSVSRNREAGEARRGRGVLRKWWEGGKEGEVVDGGLVGTEEGGEGEAVGVMEE